MLLEVKVCETVKCSEWTHFEYRHMTSSSVVGSVAIYIYIYAFKLNHKISFLPLTSLLTHTHTHIRVFQIFIYSIIVTELIRRGKKERTNKKSTKTIRQLHSQQQWTQVMTCWPEQLNHRLYIVCFLFVFWGGSKRVTFGPDHNVLSSRCCQMHKHKKINVVWCL